MIDSRLFAEYMAYYRIEPWGEERGDLRSAQIAQTIANANRDPKVQPQPFTLDDFLLRFDEKPARNWKDLMKTVQQLNAAHGGTDRRKVVAKRRPS